MKVSELLFSFILAALTVLGINYFFFNKQSQESQSVRRGQDFEAPLSEIHAKPLNLEVDFDEDQKPIDEVITKVQTKWGSLEFTNHGAVVKDLGFNHVMGDKQGQIFTIRPLEVVERSTLAFLVALNKKTPFYYNLVSKNESNESAELIYQASNDQATITKKFIVDLALHQIELQLTVEPKSNNAVMARVLVPAPYEAELAKNNNISGIVYADNAAVKKTAVSSIGSKYWAMPNLFGAENKYFIHAMVADSNNFTNRAYYKVLNIDNAISILESNEIKSSAEYKIKFYMGPKESQSMLAVDQRLYETLDYGILSPVAKVTMYLLKLLNNYLHNFGFAIIVLALLIHLLFMPFSANPQVAMQRSNEIKKKLAYLDQKYKNDREKLAFEKAEILKKQGIPDMLGCLSQLVRFPIYIALNRILNNSIELYHAPFLWINDLSASDQFVLPAFIGVAIAIQMTSMVTDARQKVAYALLALIVAAFMSNLSAGLALFICVGTWASVIQTQIQKATKA